MQNHTESPGHSPCLLTINISKRSMTWFLKHARKATFSALEHHVRPQTDVSVLPVQVGKQGNGAVSL